MPSTYSKVPWSTNNLLLEGKETLYQPLPGTDDIIIIPSFYLHNVLHTLSCCKVGQPDYLCTIAETEILLKLSRNSPVS